MLLYDSIERDVHMYRLLRNRVSAQQARERKKSYVSNLEQAAKGNEQQVMFTRRHLVHTFLGLIVRYKAL